MCVVAEQGGGIAVPFAPSYREQQQRHEQRTDSVCVCVCVCVFWEHLKNIHFHNFHNSKHTHTHREITGEEAREGRERERERERRKEARRGGREGKTERGRERGMERETCGFSLSCTRDEMSVVLSISGGYKYITFCSQVAWLRACIIRTYTVIEHAHTHTHTHTHKHIM